VTTSSSRRRTHPAPLLRRASLVCAIAAVVIAAGTRADAQEAGRFLGREEIRLLGLGMEVAPARQSVPKDVATIVSTFLHLPPSQGSEVSPFTPSTVLKGTLRGPSLTAPLALAAAPNTQFNIPPLSVPGIHTLDDIRLEADGQILMRGTPESVVIEVLEKILVTQVTTRPLTAQEIRDKGIVYDRSNFQAYNFTAAFAVQDHTVQLNFPVILPKLLDGATPSAEQAVTIPGILAPQPTKLATLIPDTLRIQRAIPNLSVVGFVMGITSQQQGRLLVPPAIPGIVVIPGQIGFLNQFFSALLMVGNAAPNGSGLTVDDLTGEILLPAGRSGVVGAADAPLRMATTSNGASMPVRPVMQAGADGKTGTADDLPAIAPGDTATAEYLIEGRREGTHTIEFNITGTLHGLPGGAVTITGRAVGSVVVRNPSFTLTFTHPDTVQVGEPYTLDVTVTNTSASIANFVSVALSSQHLSGATMAGDPTQTIETLAPQDSATVSFSLVSQVAGRVFAATLDADDNVNGRFGLKAGVGELNVPVSPDSLVLAAEANALPADLRKAALGLLGKAWSVATAPSAALPADIARFSKKIVYDRAIEVAEAGFRHSLHEALDASVTHLLFDFTGNNVGLLAARSSDAAERQFAEDDASAFDQLRRRSMRGDVFARAVGAVLAPQLGTLGAAAFHTQLAERVSWRPASLSVLASAAGGPLPVRIVIVDAAGNRTGEVDAAGKTLKSIPFSDVVELAAGAGAVSARLALIASLPAGAYRVVLEPISGVPPVPFTLSLVYPDATGQLRQVVFDSVTAGSLPTVDAPSTDPWRVSVETPGTAAPSLLAPVATNAIVEPGPSVIGLVQQKNADLVVICPSPPVAVPGGRIVAVLFNKEVPPDAVDDNRPAGTIAHYAMAENQVVGVAQQPGRRIVFLALRDPVGPYVPRSITFTDIDDGRGHWLASQSVPIEATVDKGGVVTGSVLHADGTPVGGAEVRLIYAGPVPPCTTVTISARPATDDGRFSWDFVALTNYPVTDRVQAFDAATGDTRFVNFELQREAQRLNVNIVFLGRGTLTGRALDEEGEPLAGASLRLTSLTDATQVFGATTDSNGRFTVARVPVGNVLVEAVHGGTNARVTVTERIPFAGATVTRDLLLIEEVVTETTVKYGRLTGHVLLSDGAAPAAGVPVVIYYANYSQPLVSCPESSAKECAVATTTTDQTGAFVFAKLIAGQLRAVSFNGATLQQGEARVVLPADATVDFNLLLAGGLGTVRGTVVDASGAPVPGASVGGGLSLTTTGPAGTFVLTDVPVGHREIVAVSEALGTKGSATIDIVQAGQEVNVTVVLEGVAGVAGRVFEADGTTPVGGVTVYLFTNQEEGVAVAASAVTDLLGAYTFPKVPLSALYFLSAFRSNFSDGNIMPAPLRFNNQLLRGDIVFRGRGGILGTVKNADGTAVESGATVGVSGDRVVIAGGVLGVGFEYVKNFAVAQAGFGTGAFAFSNVFVGPFTVEAAGSFSPDPVSVGGQIPVNGATTQVELRVTPTSRVTGSVVLPDGVTAAGPNIVVRFKSDAFKTVCTTEGKATTCIDVPQGIQAENAVTDENGHFVVPLVNPGRFTLTAEDPATGLSGQLRAQVSPGQTGEFTLRLLKRATLTVKVHHNDGSPVTAGARVDIRQITYPQKSLARTSDGTGAVVLGGGDAFGEGEIVVTAMDLTTGFAGRASGRITSNDNAVTIDVYLFDASGSVGGTVFRSDRLTPVANADVVISNAKGPLAFAQTDASGNYLADVIPVGPFTIDVFEPATARLGFAAGAVTLDREQVLTNVFQAAVGQVTGRVLTAGSLAPLKLWNVTLTQLSPAGRSLPLMYATTGLDGGFAFPGTTAGAFQLFAQRYPLYGAGQGRLQDEGDVVDVPIVVSVPTPEFGSVEGTVVDSFGASVGNAQVRMCTGACNSPTSSYQEFSVTAGADGSFAIAHVPVGRLEILVKAATTSQAGRATAQLAFDGDVTRVRIALVSLAHVTGSVQLPGGAIAPGVRVELSGTPSSGCGWACTAFTDSAGRFDFPNVPAHTITVAATDPVSGRHGLVVTGIHPGENELTVVLQPSARLSGRVLTAGGTPAASVAATLESGYFGSNRAAFVTSDANGAFAFSGLANGGYTLVLADPLGPGVAKRIVQIAGVDVSLGDVVLDEAAPTVAAVTPPAGALGVPLAQQVRLQFSEPLDPASLTAGAVALTGPAGLVLAAAAWSENDTVITLTPVTPLSEATRYAVQVAGLRDRVGKVIAAMFSSTFTSIDLTAPTTTGVNPSPGASGVTINTTVRLAYSEAIDASRFLGPPIVLAKAGTPIDGRLDYALGSTVVIFTPARPLEVGVRYDVAALPASDLSGNEQPIPLAFSFTTSDLTPPRVLSLTAASPTVIEGTTAIVTADVGQADIAVVDFYINDAPVFAARTRPFTLTFEATPAVGVPGDHVKLSALATDTSGQRGITPAVTFVDITADRPPIAVITAPADATSVRNGDRVTVVIHTTDDVGVGQVAYRPATGRPQDAASRSLSPAAIDRTDTFGFTVPDTLAPGSSIEIAATAVDTKGQPTAASVVRLMVLDAAPPSVAITGTSSGTVVRPGSDASAVVAVTDAGGVASIRFRTSGVVVVDETRAIDPAQPSVAASFTFPVPANAGPADTIRLDATAFDRAGNSATAATVILAIADLDAPRVTLRTLSGRSDAIVGSSVAVIVDAEDAVGVARIDVRGSGAFTLADGRSISPPLGSTSQQFNLTVPATAQEGDVLTVEAIARDIFGNISAAVVLPLTLRVLADVTLPSSVIVLAGESAIVPIQLSAAAPASGVSVKLTTSSAGTVTVSSPVTIAAGQSDGQATIAGVAGGTASITASILGIDRASMTVTVQGAVVSGTVFDSTFQAVAGAQVAVSAGTTIETVVSDGNGHYQVVNDFGFYERDITVRVFDTEHKRLGVAMGQLNAPRGYVRLNVIVFSVGSIGGQVRLADTVTPAAPGATVELREQNGTLVQNTSTGADQSYMFDSVPLGTYIVEARDTNGNRGRATVTIDAGGQQRTVHVPYLGRGSVAGTVRSGNAPVPTAQVRLFANSIFGDAPVLERSVAADGTFRFDNVFVGVATVQATDQASGLAGVTTGALTQDGQVLVSDVTLASFGSVSGTVYRADGATTVPNAQVTITSSSRTLFTLSDAQGRYAFAAVPFGDYTVTARHQPTHGIGLQRGQLTTAGEQATTDVLMYAQGTVIVTVVHSTGAKASGASVAIHAIAPLAQDTFTVTADADGVAVLDNVLAGTFTLTARSGPLSGTVTGTLTAGGVVQVTVTLQPTGSLAGVVFLPDEVTPAQGGTVAIQSQNEYQLRFNIDLAADGTYRFDGLPLHQFVVSVSDASGLARASRSATLSVEGDTVTANVTYTAVGLVAGRVINPGGSSAGGFGVTLRSQNPHFGGFRYATTDAFGLYEFANVYAGTFVVTAANDAAGLLGEETGTVVTEGQTVTRDIQLAANAIRLPVYKYDGSNFPFDVQPNGSILSGMNAVFNGAYPDPGGAFILDILSGGVANRFTGTDLGTKELSGNQLVTRQNNIAGLNVTRKVFVPRSHFARYLELLANPTASPITVSVRLQHSITPYAGRKVSTIATSSGDATLDIGDPSNPDRWIVASIYDDVDPFLKFAWPSLAWTFDGAGARRRVGEAAIGLATPSPFTTGGRLNYEWRDVTIPPGGVVGLMHFGVQQSTRAAARASAERLVELPPEALEGLSAAEIAAIENFNVPATGISAIAPLPPMGGTITGRVFEANGTTPAKAAHNGMRVQSSVPVFPRTLTGHVLADGTFRIATGNDPSIPGVWIGIPLAPFTLNAQHVQARITRSYDDAGGVDGPSVSAVFPPGETTVAVTYAFTNTAMVFAKIRRANGAVVVGTGNSVYASRTAPPPYPYVIAEAAVAAADGTYSLFGLLPGTYELRASVSHPQALGNLSAVGTFTIAVGDIGQADVTLPATGSVTGTLRTGSGGPVTSQGAAVTLRDPTSYTYFSAQVSQSNGVFLISDVPAGSYSLEAYDQTSGVTVRAPVTIVANQAVSQDLSYPATGTVTGRVTGQTGPLANAQVNLFAPLQSGRSAYTNALGVFTFTNVAAGDFTIAAYDPAGSALGADARGRLTTHGETVTIDLRIQGVPLPTSLSDANGFEFRAQGEGRVVGAANAYYDAFALTFYANGNPQVYNVPYRSWANTELNGRQLVITQSAFINYLPPGLQVSRKIFVPENGYFARFLEIFENTGTAPLTLDAQIQSALAPRTNVNIVNTSSGDRLFTTADRWLITDDGTGAAPVLVDLFGGPGAAITPAAAGFAFTNTSGYGPYYRWNGFTIQPGQRVVLMHFAAQQFDAAGAQASVDRLVQLPPEALTGLTAEEIAAIHTFAVPLDGSSPLPPLSDTQETMTANGRVYDQDGTTPLAGAQVTFGSAIRLFGAPASTVSDSGGNFMLTKRIVDRYLLQAKHPKSGAASVAVTDAVVAGQTTLFENIVFTNTGTLRGVVRTTAGTVVTTGAQVQVSGGSLSAALTVTVAGDGSYVVSGLSAGSYTVQVLMNVATTPVHDVAVAAGGTTVLDLVVPSVVTLRVEVTQIDGTPVANAIVYLQTADQPYLQFIGYANASGVLLKSPMPQGAFTVMGQTNSGQFIGLFTGSIGPADGGQVVTVLIRPVGAGAITGHVVAGNGQTGVPYATVSIVDVASGQNIAYTSTDVTGAFNMPTVRHGAQGVRVVVSAPGNDSVRQEATGAFTSAGQTLTFDFTLPLAIVRGAVYQADGVTPATGIRLEAGQAADGGEVARLYPAVTGHTYMALLVPGAATIRAVDRDTGSSSSHALTIADVSAALTLDISLPPTGTIAGVVRDESGQPLSYVDVAVSNTPGELYYDLYGSTDADGAYRFDRIPLGAFTVQSCVYGTSELCASTSGRVTTAGATSSADVTMPPTGTVQGVAHLGDGSALPGFYSYVRVMSASAGPLSSGHYVYTYGSGTYQSSVPVGPVSASFRSGTEAGLSTGTLTSAGPLSLGVVGGAGNVVPSFQQIPPGADAFTYGSSCTGSLRSGGQPDGRSPYSESYMLRVNGVPFDCLEAARQELDGRQMAYGPYPLAGLQTARRVFVPSAGGFARYLDTFTNSGTAPITVDVRIESWWRGVAALSVAPAETNGTFAITTDGTGGGSGRPAIAHIFAGSNATTAPSAVEFQPFVGISFYQYTVTVPAGGEVTLMHFSVQRTPGDLPGVREQAEELVNLTDPNALAGMTAAEKARVINFRIP
jgi:hypothetical protein